MENQLSVALREASQRSDFVNLINTNFHECGLAPPAERISEAVQRYLASDELRIYRPDASGHPVLREAVARFYAPDGIGPHADRVIITASASESYNHIFAGVCEGGGAVLLPRPGYPLFEDVARRTGLEPRFYDLRREHGWGIDPDEIARAFASGPEAIAAIVLISPNNPTGAIVDEPTIRRIGEFCQEHGAVLIVDEVFSEFRFAPHVASRPATTASGAPRGVAEPTSRASAPVPFPRPGVLCPGTLTFTINGTSKLFASPDLKVSWIVVTGPDDQAEAAHEALEIENDIYLNASPINQYVAAELLGAGRHAPTAGAGGTGAEITRAVVAAVAKRRSVALEALDGIEARHAGTLEWVEPAGGIHLPIVITNPPRDLDDEGIAIELLRDHGLAVHPGYLYGVEEPPMIVISYLSPGPVIEEGLARLERFLTRRRTS